MERWDYKIDEKKEGCEVIDGKAPKEVIQDDETR